MSVDQISFDEVPLEYWPLVHGSRDLASKKDVIKREGLMASTQAGQRALNSLQLDVALERTRYVFLAPARTRGGYGNGCFVVVDPIALDRDGAKYSLHDIGLLFPFVQSACVTGHLSLPQGVPSCDKIKRAIERATNASARSCGGFQDILEALLHGPDFREWAESLFIDRRTFMGQMENRAFELGMNPRAFLSRTSADGWKYNEEILVPRVDQSHVIGCWLSGNWEEWNTPTQPQTRMVLDYMLTSLRQPYS